MCLGYVLEIVLRELVKRSGGLPQNFIVTVPKVVIIEQVEFIVAELGRLERSLGTIYPIGVLILRRSWNNVGELRQREIDDCQPHGFSVWRRCQHANGISAACPKR